MRHRNRLWTLAVAAIMAVAWLATPAHAAAADDFPTDPMEALQHYESMVEDWDDGPVQYILLEDEEDLWDDLETNEAREAFKSWFWDKRDPDLRDDENPFKMAFYTRVAEANERFQAGGVFQGWESDRGRVWVTLGTPDNIQPHMGLRFDSQDWTYYTVGRDRAFETVFGEFHVLFVQPEPADSYKVFDPFMGTGIWDQDILDAMEYAREAYVVNPDLEKPAEIS